DDLLAADNTAEVVGVLGHEVAHVTERHVAERLVTAFGVQTLVNIALGRDPGTLSQLVAGLLSQGYLLKSGRAQETESDRVALDYVMTTQWNPVGLATFFEKLAASPQPPTILSTHPHPADRAKDVRNLIRRTSSRAGNEAGVEELNAIKARIRSTSPAAPPAAPAPSSGTGTGTRTRAPQ
ncbi:MAG: M48 family metalloprotease, partial [Myxococcota bacterium]